MFLTLEGMEGSGKSTLRDLLAERIRSQGHKLLLTFEPGGSPLGAEIRKMLLSTESKICSEAELFLFLADRAQHVQSRIAPALTAGTWVLCDRYADSTIVYQGYGRGLDPENVYALNEKAIQGLWPQYTLLLDVPTETGLLRARNRNADKGLAIREGRFEAEALAFHERIREGFLSWAKCHAERFIVLDGTKTPDVILQDAVKALRHRGCDV